LSRDRKKLLALPKLFRIAEWQIRVLCGGNAGGQTKEEVIETNERLRVVRIRLDGSYDTAKRALVELMCKYTDSKQVRNVFQRYNLLKVMIKVRRWQPGVIRYGTPNCFCSADTLYTVDVITS
jgi:hypothetical protein